MPEHIRALVVIVALASAVFVVAMRPITGRICAPEDFKRRCMLWFFFTLAAFLAHSFWLFVFAIVMALLLTLKSEPNRFALYFGLILVLPPIQVSVTGLGVFNELFSVHHVRLLALCVLLPTFLALRWRSDVEPLGSLWCDRLLLGYLGLEVILTLPHRTLTAVLRDSVFYAFTDVFLPYYVASRSLRTLKSFRDALGAFFVSSLVLSTMLMFEFWRQWALYQSLAAALEVHDFGWLNYIPRGGSLRAMGSVGEPISAGYTCAVALGFYFYLKSLVPHGMLRNLGFVVLAGGLIGALSRGPWVGAFLILVVFILLGPAPRRGLMYIGLFVLLSLPFLVTTDAGRQVIDLLPWIGTVEAHNVELRERLAVVAFQVFLETPFFGRFDVMMHPAMESLRTDIGIIDVVNTYVVVALRGGGVSLALFTGFFAVAGWLLLRTMRGIKDQQDERRILGRALFSTLIGMLFMIGTVSPILNIPTLYWCVGGLAVGYVRMVAAAGDQPVSAGSTASGAAMRGRTAARVGAGGEPRGPRRS